MTTKSTNNRLTGRDPFGAALDHHGPGQPGAGPAEPPIPPTPAAAGGVADAVDLWDQETESGKPAALTVVRMGPDEQLLLPFTTTLTRVETHYLNYEAIRGYVHCGGAGCLLCRIGKSKEVRDLLPVYLPVERIVAVLSVPTAVRAQALRPQLKPVLERLKRGGGARELLAVRRPEFGRYEVQPITPPEDADDGAEQVGRFVERFNAGEVDVAGVYPRLSQYELAEIPEVAAAMKLRGVTLP